MSKGKIIRNYEMYKKNFPKYLVALDELQIKYPVRTLNELKNLTNFKKNKIAKRHNWFEYNQGYTHQLIEMIILRELKSNNQNILDPFTGVGTTNLVAKSLGYRSIGFDINPVAHLAAEVKTSFYTETDIKHIYNIIKSYNLTRKAKFVPNISLIYNSFPHNFSDLMNIKGYYQSIENKKIRDFFKLAYLSVLEDISNRVKDGNGIKYDKSKKKIKNTLAFFLSKCSRMLSEIEYANNDTETILINDSLITSVDHHQILQEGIDLTIFSPPYANCFDYCEVYKLEFWMGEFVKSYRDFDNYRNLAMRSHVNSRFSHDFSNRYTFVEIMANLINCFNIWNNNIPDMLRGYFDDISKFLQKIFSNSRNGSRVYIIVANSAYKGIIVPTDLLIAQISESVGFQVCEIIKSRKMRASSQQIQELEDTYDKMMRESIIILEKNTKKIVYKIWKPDFTRT